MKKMEDPESKGVEIFTTAINVAKFYYGAYRSRNKESALTTADRFLKPFSILSLGYTSAKIYGELAEKMKSNTICDLDLFIASIALANKQTIVTRNTKHFERVPGLKLESW